MQTNFEIKREHYQILTFQTYYKSIFRFAYWEFLIQFDVLKLSYYFLWAIFEHLYRLILHLSQQRY
jgi:hypothetical protein